VSKQYVRFTTEEREKDIKLTLEALMQGKSYTEIAEDLGRSVAYIFNIKNLLIERGMITQEEIKSFSKERKLAVRLKNDELFRDNLLASEKTKAGRITNESMQKNKKGRSQRERQLIKNYQIAKACLQEGREIDSSTCAKFVSSCREMYQNNSLALEDIPLLRKAIEYNPITEYTMNFMLRVYISFNKNHDAIKFLNSCIGYLIEDPNLVELAKKTKATIIHCQKQKKAVEMLNGGMPIEHVFRKVGLTESEVIELKNKYTHSGEVPPIVVGNMNIEI
jgi:transposase